MVVENPTPHTCPASSCGRPAFVSHLTVECSSPTCVHASKRAVSEYEAYVRKLRLLSISDEEETTVPMYNYSFWK